MSIRNNSKQ